MKKIIDLSDLLSEQLKELLKAEKLQHEALPKFLKKAESGGLKHLIQKNINETEKQIQRLEDALLALDKNKKTGECKVMAELLDRGLQLAKSCENNEVLESGMISSLQCIKHFEIAEYGTLASFAELLENDKVLKLLKMTIAEEKELDQALSELAEKTINQRAKELSKTIA